jgi:hypothetical protein
MAGRKLQEIELQYEGVIACAIGSEFEAPLTSDSRGRLVGVGLWVRLLSFSRKPEQAAMW